MPTSAQELGLIDSLLSQHIDILRLEAGIRVRVLTLITLMQDDLVKELRQRTLADLKKAEINSLLGKMDKVIERYYAAVDTVVADAMMGTALVTTKGAATTVSAASLGEMAAMPLTTPSLARLARSTLILGAQSSDWWSKQSQDTSFRFANAVRQGLIGNESSEQIVARITGTKVAAGVMDISRKQARGLVHSSLMAAANASAMATYEKNIDLIKGWRQLSVLDGRTSLICIAYSNAEWDLDYKPINGNRLSFDGGTPRHFNCRSKIIPILKTFKEQGIEGVPDLPPRTTRASALGPVKTTMTFNQFLKRRTKEQVEEQLGKGRAELWRSGKITLQQLLDMKGNPLTLAKLKAKYE